MKNTLVIILLNLLLNHPSALFSPSRSFPILIYFKETQTPVENWNIGPGEQANSPEAIAKGAGKQLFYHLP